MANFVTPTPAQQALLRQRAERIIGEFVAGVQESITADWLKLNERDRGVFLMDSSAEALAVLVRTAKVSVSFYDDDEPEQQVDCGEDDSLPPCTTNCCDGFDSADLLFLRRAA